MSQDVFKINNLVCSYDGIKKILEIKQLNIPKGKLIFVVGKSGIGKSTFIETLGFMNSTILSQKANTIIFNSRNGVQHDLTKFWQFSNEEQSNIRKENFSFIFQNTNLMENFTSGENMMVNLLINGSSLDDAKRRVLDVMSKLSLEANLFDREITELSGGQRQRLAFVRAVTAEFEVLFGDEPTGNLDEKTASEVMTALKKLIVSENKTAIIVSHDLKLAELFADIIIPLTFSLNNEEKFGEVLESNILCKKGSRWERGNGEEEKNLTLYLKTSFEE